MNNVNSSYPLSTIWHSTSANWLDLPDEIWLNILCKLSPHDLGRVCQVCRRTYTLVQDPSLDKSHVDVVANIMKGIFFRTKFAHIGGKYREIFRTKAHLIANLNDGMEFCVWELSRKEPTKDPAFWVYKEMLEDSIMQMGSCIGITREGDLISSVLNIEILREGNQILYWDVCNVKNLTYEDQILSCVPNTKNFMVFNLLKNEFLEESLISKEALKIEENGKYSIDTKTNKLIGLFPGGIIKIRDLMTNSEKTLTGKAEYNDIPPVLTEEGKLLLASGTSIQIWDLAKGSLESKLEGHEQEITSLKATRGRIASGSKDETIKIWNLNSMKCTGTLLGVIDRTSFKCLSFSQDGNILFSGGDEIKVWDLISYTCLYNIPKSAHQQIIFEADGKLIVINGFDQVPWMFDFGATNQQVWEQIADNFDRWFYNDVAERFLRMPLEERKKIYAEVSLEKGETAFHELNFKEKATAIRKYLKQLP